nr:TetR family transcriptional regulator [Actinoplanes regularis]
MHPTDHRRERIAAFVGEDEGCDALTVDAVAARSGVQRTTVYRRLAGRHRRGGT